VSSGNALKTAGEPIPPIWVNMSNGSIVPVIVNSNCTAGSSDVPIIVLLIVILPNGSTSGINSLVITTLWSGSPSVNTTGDVSIETKLCVAIGYSVTTYEPNSKSVNTNGFPWLTYPDLPIIPLSIATWNWVGSDTGLFTSPKALSTSSL